MGHSIVESTLLESPICGNPLECLEDFLKNTFTGLMKLTVEDRPLRCPREVYLEAQGSYNQAKLYL